MGVTKTKRYEINDMFFITLFAYLAVLFWSFHNVSRMEYVVFLHYVFVFVVTIPILFLPYIALYLSGSPIRRVDKK